MSRRQDHPHIDLSKPSAQALAFLLRHREFWPEGFEWDYCNCRTCAMGLAVQLWGLKVSRDGSNLDYVKVVSEAIGLESMKAIRAFIHLSFGYRGFVTPEDVADALERFKDIGRQGRKVAIH